MAQVKNRKRYDPYRNISYAYDGSAARVLEPEESSRPAAYAPPRERPAARPKVRVREAGAVSLFAVCGFAAVAVMAVLILMSYVQLASISSQVVALESQMTQLKSEEAILRSRYEQAYDLSAIESALTANGSMSRPQAGQMIYVNMTEPDSVEVYGSGETKGGSFLDAVREIVDNVLSYF